MKHTGSIKRIVCYPCDNEGIHKCVYEEWDGERMNERIVEWNGRAIIAFSDVKRRAMLQGWWKELDRERIQKDKFNERANKLIVLKNAPDERTLRNWKSLHYEKLKGSRNGQRSIRLNSQWRLIFELDNDVSPTKVRILGIEDYH